MKYLYLLLLLPSIALAKWECQSTPQECVNSYVKESTVRISSFNHESGVTGTGFLIGKDRALTALHVVQDSPKGRYVHDSSLTKTGTYHVESSKDDLALVSTKGSLQEYPRIGVPRAGDTVYAAGFPHGTMLLITTGMYSGTEKSLGVGDDKDVYYIRTYHGMSGGPLMVVRQGELLIVGMISTGAEVQGVALPITGSPSHRTLKEFLE